VQHKEVAEALSGGDAALLDYVVAHMFTPKYSNLAYCPTEGTRYP
jgi:hypothetical protein